MDIINKILGQHHVICHVTRIHLIKNYQYYIILSQYCQSRLFDEKSKREL